MRRKCFFILSTILFFMTASHNCLAEPQGKIRFAYFTRPLYYIRPLIYETLVSNVAGRTSPGLAASWRWLDDGKILEMRLREGVRFHNGEPFDAQAVKENFEAYQKYGWPVEYRKVFQRVKFRIIDVETVQFILADQDSFFLPRLVKFWIMAPECLRNYSGSETFFWGAVPNRDYGGTGPFVLRDGFSTESEWSEIIVLNANRGYWDPQYPGVEEILLFNPKKELSASSEEDAFMKVNQAIMDTEGIVDISKAVYSLTLKIAQSTHAKIVKMGQHSFLGLFNMRKKNSIWRDIRLRKAINYAIDRETIRRISQGNAEILSALIPEDQVGHNPELQPYPYDPLKARQLLHEAGISEGFKVRVLIHEAATRRIPAYRRFLKEIGLDPEIEALPTDSLIRKYELDKLDEPIEEQSWDMVIIWNAPFTQNPFLDIYSLYFKKDGWQRWIAEDDNLEEMIDAALHTYDEERQADLLRRMEKYVHENALALFLYAPRYIYSFNKNVILPPSQDEQRFLREVSVTSSHWSRRQQ